MADGDWLAGGGQLAGGGEPQRDGRRRPPLRTGRTDKLGPAKAGTEDECLPGLGHARFRDAEHAWFSDARHGARE